MGGSAKDDERSRFVRGPRGASGRCWRRPTLNEPGRASAGALGLECGVRGRVATEDKFGIVGKVVARTYEVESVVAEGGFGVVYRAYHRGFRAKVALKCLKVPEEFSDDERRKFLAQFRGEAEVLFRLSSRIPAIVRPLQVDAFEGPGGKLVPFLALEWLEGRTLDAIILRRREKGRPPIPLGNLVRLLTPVASALEQAHHFEGDGGAMTVVHRDMKPENVFIARMGGEDVARILDFGISKVKSAANQHAGKASQTSDALVAFSPAFAAPEQWVPRRFGQTGRWTDVWGLAITLVEAAKGTDVIQGDQAEMMGTILDPGRRPTPRAEGVPTSDAVERVFLRALAVDPRERFQTIGEFWDALVAALDLVGEIPSLRTRSDAKGPPRDRSTTDRFDSVYPAPASRAALPSTSDVGARPPTPGSSPVSGARLLEPLENAGNVRLPRSGPNPSAATLGGATPSRGTIDVVAPTLRPPPKRGAPGGVRRRPSLWRELSPALALFALALAITFLDRVYTEVSGGPLSVGPLRASWLGALVMVGALFSGGRVLRRQMDPE